MARVAFVMDKLLRKIGLSGRSFVPMLIGFGCTVPAVMATRTLPSDTRPPPDDPADAVHELLGQDPDLCRVHGGILPGSMLCSLMALLYFGGMVVGVLIALLLNHTVFRGNPVPFVMELPNYRLPTAQERGACSCWDKAQATSCSARLRSSLSATHCHLVPADL